MVFIANDSTMPTICERNSQILNGNYSVRVIDYRRISPEDLKSQAKSLTYTETNKPAFLPVEESLIHKVYNRWNRDGLVAAIEVFCKTPEVHPALLSVASKLNDFVTYCNDFRRSNSSEVCNKTDEERKFFFACHPHTSRLAIVLGNRVKVICLNRMDSNNEIILKDKRISKISCLAWRPKSAMSLAVGSENGLLVWLLDPNITNKRPGVSATRYLQSQDMTNEVNSVSWSPCAKLVACSCKNSTSIWIWNILSQSCSSVQRVGSDLKYLNWSPCGQRLMSSTYSGIFRIWESKTWDCAKWADLNGCCTNACWSNDGFHLLFTVENEPFIYSTRFFPNKDDNAIDLGGSGVAMKCADVSMFSSEIEEDAEINGNVKITAMAWDSTNSRLAVIYNCGEKHKIALYHSQVQPQLQLMPCGFVHGEEGEEGKQIEFVNGFDKGALLAVHWSSDHISLLPFYFNQKLTTPRENSLNVNFATKGGGEHATTFIHQRTLNESTFNHDLNVTSGLPIFSNLE